MNQVYHHYETWEDWHAGLYDTEPSEDPDLRDAVAELLRDTTQLFYAMQHVATQWVHAAAHVLTNASRNHQAWLGQAAACYITSAPEHITKAAWWTLTPHQRHRANAVADQVLVDWKAAHYARPIGLFANA